MQEEEGGVGGGNTGRPAAWSWVRATERWRRDGVKMYFGGGNALDVGGEGKRSVKDDSTVPL